MCTLKFRGERKRLKYTKVKCTSYALHASPRASLLRPNILSGLHMMLSGSISISSRYPASKPLEGKPCIEDWVRLYPPSQFRRLRGRSTVVVRRTCSYGKTHSLPPNLYITCLRYYCNPGLTRWRLTVYICGRHRGKREESRE